LFSADKPFVDKFLHRAEEILDVALAAGYGASDCTILFDRMGGMRMLDPAGWSMAGLIREFGAQEVYRIERRNGAVRVEGWSASEQCLIQRKTAAQKLPACYPSTLQAVPRLAA
jgi:hypothetical protein